jgi:hypothetical protein
MAVAGHLQHGPGHLAEHGAHAAQPVVESGRTDGRHRPARPGPTVEVEVSVPPERIDFHLPQHRYDLRRLP